MKRSFDFNENTWSPLSQSCRLFHCEERIEETVLSDDNPKDTNLTGLVSIRETDEIV